ncbi:helix-turn-helix domain-containing protein [Chryseobacterium indoltheticum]|uniref:helix-turn-helix domain-containing protein n=1 Tax=Chryseobacterium indoltheticum TaxID=254 RepID=UPI003F493E3C
MTLGEKLKKARINKNFTQEYLAEMLNVSQKTYSNFENDKSKPGFSQVEEMAKVLRRKRAGFFKW